MTSIQNMRRLLLIRGATTARAADLWSNAQHGLCTAAWGKSIALLLVGCTALHAIGSLSHAQVSIKSLTTLDGVRINQLTGMGLVAGLNGTGGKSPVTRRFAQDMLQNFGLRASPAERLLAPTDTRQRTDNLSVVTVTAELPIFARPGSRIDVIVSAFDEAKSLLGGTLITTPLYGVDGNVYAVAAGPVSAGGFAFDGDGASVQKGYPTSGRIPHGATVEEAVPTDFLHCGNVRLLLRNIDFETARRVADAINARYPGVAFAEDAASVKLIVPAEYALDPIAFVGMVTAIPVVPDMSPRVVINERTGTIVVGHNVQISSVAIAHGNLAVLTTESPIVSQPTPFSEGRTAVVPRTDIQVEEERRPVFVLGETTNVGDLAQALNVLGVTPRDLSAIFQQLQSAGALHAELLLQ